MSSTKLFLKKMSKFTLDVKIQFVLSQNDYKDSPVKTPCGNIAPFCSWPQSKIWGQSQATDLTNWFEFKNTQWT